MEAGPVIAGYACLFGVVDLGRDMVLPGAFRESLARRGPSGVRLLYQHDPAEPIGVWTELAEDARGLYVRGRLSRNARRARECSGEPFGHARLALCLEGNAGDQAG